MAKLGRKVSRECGVISTAVIPGRRHAPSPESITTELCLGHDGAPAIIKQAVVVMDSGPALPRVPE